ncbi:MAG: hypothetical protein BWY79_02082 [Actinobacteria bacterium ADurb.Bin444]|nr:MAG: hypothetical protein BWY79_02082 [Actinobacteria bacterium ADurb.Bin444]
MLEQNGGRGITLERYASGQEFEENYSQGIQIGARVRGQILCLLRRHIVGGAHHESRLRVSRAPENAGYTEISEHWIAFLREENVGGLDVSMDHALTVGIIESGAQRCE